MQPQNTEQDQRKTQLEQWVAEQVGQPVDGSPASADASFRRYFRFRVDGRSLIGMDAPPPQEDCAPFVRIGQQLQQAGVHVPEILAQDLERGFLLLSDLGTQTWLHAISLDNADDWFEHAMDQLLLIQQTPADQLPAYDEALLRRELALFPDWFLEKELNLTLSDSQQASWQRICDLLVAQALRQSKVFVHRDFMPRNLMVSEPNPAVIDFQDAVYGPVSYDAICLFKDAFLSWPEDKVEQWLMRYWQKARDADIAVPADPAAFLLDCDLMGAHRHLKVIGIFARICHRDGKGHYLEDVPRFFRYLKTVIERRPELAELNELLNQVCPQHMAALSS